MLRYAADENVNGGIVRGLRRRDPTVDIVRVQDQSISGATDPEVIALAFDNNRIILTHVRRTFEMHVRERLLPGVHTAGVFVVRDALSHGHVIDDLLAAHLRSEMSEWTDAIEYLPL